MFVEKHEELHPFLNFPLLAYPLTKGTATLTTQTDLTYKTKLKLDKEVGGGFYCEEVFQKAFQYVFQEIIRKVFQDVFQEVFQDLFQEVFQKVFQDVVQEIIREVFRKAFRKIGWLNKNPWQSG